MAVELKPLTPAGIERAIDRAHYFHLLHEPSQAEAACLDILSADPDNQGALVQLNAYVRMILQAKLEPRSDENEREQPLE